MTFFTHLKIEYDFDVRGNRNNISANIGVAMIMTGFQSFHICVIVSIVFLLLFNK